MLPGNDGQLLGGIIADEGPIIPHGGLLFVRKIDNLLDAIEVSR